jgi:hypothetical protein
MIGRIEQGGEREGKLENTDIIICVQLISPKM